MKIEKCIKKSFAVIGKEGSTLEGTGFIQNLWEDANSHFSEVECLAKKDENGNFVGFWGAMSVNKKYIGRNMDIIVSKYCKDTLEEFSKADKSTAFITHSEANKSMVEIARKILQEQGFENIYETKAGATISCHCGKNTLGILYING